MLEKRVLCPAAGRRLGNDEDDWDLFGDSKTLRGPVEVDVRSIWQMCGVAEDHIRFPCRPLLLLL
jgi:hypothetical protein